jgi:hypothetical protein
VARLRSGPESALLAVAALHAISPYLLRGSHPGYGWDETVYISQLDPHSVAAYFSAPRARGLTLVTAPMSLLSSSVTLMRAWLALLSGVGLYFAFLPWLRTGRGWTVPVAALLWSGLWVDIYYGFEAMPNQWIAYAGVGAVGWLLVARDEPASPRPAVYLAGWLCFAALIRPSDSVAIVIVLVVFTAVDRARSRHQRVRLAVVMLVAVALGWVEWIAEASARFGGVGSRLHAASVENGGAGWHWELVAQMRALAGPLLCRYHCDASAPLGDRIWWLGLPLLVGAGLVVGRRRGVGGADLLASAVGITLATEYVVLVGYAAPRFLAPSYALLAIPVSEGIIGLVGAVSPRRWRLVAVAGLVVILAAQEVGQARIGRAISAANDAGSARSHQLAAFLRAQGVHGRCALAGSEAGPTSFRMGCYGIDTVDWPPIAARLAAEPGYTVVLILSVDAEPTSFYRTWRAVVFRPTGGAPRRVFLSAEAGDQAAPRSAVSRSPRALSNSRASSTFAERRHTASAA